MRYLLMVLVLVFIGCGDSDSTFEVRKFYQTKQNVWTRNIENIEGIEITSLQNDNVISGIKINKGNCEKYL